METSAVRGRARSARSGSIAALGVATAMAVLVGCTPGDNPPTTTTTSPSTPSTTSTSTTTTPPDVTTTTDDPGTTTTTTTTTTVPGSGTAWQLRATHLLVGGDGCPSIATPCHGGLRPYLIQIAFRSTFGVESSTVVDVVQPSTTMTCAGGCRAGSIATVPAEQGTIRWSGIRTTDKMPNSDGGALSVAGAVLLAFDADDADSVTSALATARELAEEIRSDVGATVENVDLGGSAAGVVAAVRSLFSHLGASVEASETPLRDADRLVAARPVVFVAASGRLAESLFAAGLSDTPRLDGVASTLTESAAFSVTFDGGGATPIAYDVDMVVTAE